MTVFQLIETTKVGTEDCYHYAAEDGQKVTFHAHPTTAWNWCILEGERQTASAIINAACEAGFQPPRMALLVTETTKRQRRS